MQREDLELVSGAVVWWLTSASRSGSRPALPSSLTLQSRSPPFFLFPAFEIPNDVSLSCLISSRFLSLLIVLLLNHTSSSFSSSSSCSPLERRRREARLIRKQSIGP